MSSERFVSSQALLLILKLKARKVWSGAISVFLGKGKASTEQPLRAGTARKNSKMPLHGLVSIFLALIVALVFSLAVVVPFMEKLKEDKFFVCITVELAALFFMVLSLSLGLQNKEIEQLESEVEWFLTMPITNSTIYLSKIAQSTLFNFGWIIFFPLYCCLLWVAGYRWSIPIIAFLLTGFINLLIAASQTFIEILCQKVLSINMVRNFQLLMTLIGIFMVLFFYIPVWWDHYIPIYSREIYYLGLYTKYLPTGICYSLLNDTGRQALGINIVIFLFEIFLFAGLGWLLISWASTKGMEAIQTSHRQKAYSETATSAPALFSGIFKKEMLMLGRSKRLILSILIPYIDILVILLLPVEGLELRKTLLSNPLHWGTISLLMGLVLLGVIAPAVLNHEGNALWMLFTFPQLIKDIAKKKAQFWIGLAWFFSFSLYAIGIAGRGKFHKDDLYSLLWILIAIPIYGLMCVSWGVLMTDAQEQINRRNMRGDVSPITLSFTILIISGLFLPNFWNKVSSLTTLIVLGISLWKKACSHIDFILDPTAKPAPRIHAADGLMCVYLFFSLQSLTVALLSLFTGLNSMLLALASYFLASIIVVAVVFFYLRNEGVDLAASLPFWHKDVMKARTAAIVALKSISLAVLIGVFSNFVLPTEILPVINFQSDFGQLILGSVLGLLVLVVIKPIVEEILYRGLVFQGLSQNFGVYLAMLFSALIFSIQQQPIWIVPYFFIGIIMAWAYQKSEVLLVPIFVNFTFNLVIIIGKLASHWQNLKTLKYR